MAFAAVNSASFPQAFSIGPVKQQVLTYSAASGDVAGTITADSLASISDVIVGGSLKLTAAPTFSGNVITLAFADPVATVYGSVIVLGK